jgi:DNA modification methylase
MGKRWDGGDIAFQTATWREVWRVLKPGGYVAAFGAPKNFGRLQCAILDAGFEERDCILNMVNPDDAVIQFIESLSESQADAFMRCMAQSELSSAGFLAWVFGVGFPKGRDIGKDTGLPEWDGFNVAIKPAFEPIVLARKPLSEPTVAANVLKWRTGALNIDASRIHSGESTARVYTAKRTAPGATQNATGERHGIELFEGASKEGRWPANVCHDGSDEVVGAFPTTTTGGRTWKGGEEEKSNWRETEGRSDAKVRSAYSREGDSGSVARFFYSAKASKADRNGSKHPTVKPIALMEWLCTLITPPGGTVLDPFAGSGTTGIAATNRGFRCVLVEREAEYVTDIRARFNPSPLTRDEILEKVATIAAEFPDMDFKVRFPSRDVDIAPLLRGLARAARIRALVAA